MSAVLAAFDNSPLISSVPSASDLHENGLNGTLPNEIGQLEKLTSLDLVQNRLIGSIPSQLGKLTALDSLALNQNQLIGSIPDELGKLRELTLLYLFNNTLSGTIPSSLGQLDKIHLMVLFENKLTGRVPPLPFEHYSLDGPSCCLVSALNPSSGPRNRFQCPLPAGASGCRCGWGGGGARPGISCAPA